MTAGVSDLFDLLAEWLAVCEDAVATTFGGAIAQAFVARAQPAIDCPPQLSVHPGGPGIGETAPLSPPLMPGQRPAITGSVHLINMTCTVIRCAPTLSNDGQPPPIAAQEVAARETAEDVWAIWNWTRQKHIANELFASPSQRRELYMDPAVPVQDEGGAGGWAIPIRVALWGYDITDPGPT